MGISEFKASLVYKSSSRTDWATQRNPVLNKTKQNKTKQNKMSFWFICIGVFDCVYLGTICVYCILRGQESPSHALELVLYTVLNYHVGVENQTLDPWKNSQCF